MAARTAILWLVVLTLVLVGATLAVDAMQPRLQPRPAPVRSAPPPSSDTPLLMTSVHGLSDRAGGATIVPQVPPAPSNPTTSQRSSTELSRSCDT
jgi:hypothetical protein